MLPVGWLVAAVALAVLLTLWFTFTLTRLDRLHARVDAAQAALDAQLVRRAAALQHVAESPASVMTDPERVRLEGVAHAALAAGLEATGLGAERESGPGAARENAENAVGRAVAELVAASPGDVDEHGMATMATAATAGAAVAELREAAARVLIARRFYNDAVRDTRALRARRLPRLLRMAGRREMPQFFDIDDTLPAAARSARAESPPEEDHR